MENQELGEIIRASQAVVRRGRFACLKAKSKPAGDHFMVSQDSDEITVITEEMNLPATAHTEATTGFKLIEVRVAKPFVAKGFLARLTRVIADTGSNVLVVSTFSKDYLLVREKALPAVVAALRREGLPITEE